jgi:hypothetical protein
LLAVPVDVWAANVGGPKSDAHLPACFVRAAGNHREYVLFSPDAVSLLSTELSTLLQSSMTKSKGGKQQTSRRAWEVIRRPDGDWPGLRQAMAESLNHARVTDKNTQANSALYLNF